MMARTSKGKNHQANLNNETKPSVRATWKLAEGAAAAASAGRRTRQRAARAHDERYRIAMALRRMDPRPLTRWLAHAPSASALLADHERYRATFDAKHLGQAWYRLGVLTRGSSDERSWLARNAQRLSLLRMDTLERMGSLDARALCDTARGLSWSGLHRLHPQSFWGSLSVAAVKRLDGFTPQGLSGLCCAFAASRARSPELIEAVAARAGADLPALVHADGGAPTLRHVALLAWAAAAVGLAPRALFSALAEAPASWVERANEHDLGCLGWAFAAADFDAPRLFGEPFQARAAELEESGLVSASGRAQLQQWVLWWGLERGRDVERVPRRVRDAWRDALSMSHRRRPADAPRSPMEEQLAATLRALGWAVRPEACVHEGYTLDLLATKPAAPEITVEADGRSHYVGVPSRLDHAAATPRAEVHEAGATILKRRQLRALGRTLLSVPYFEWEPLAAIDDARERERAIAAYVASALERAL